MQQDQIYRIMKLVKDGEEVKNECGRGRTVIAALTAAVEEDGQVIVRELPSANGMLHYTIHKILH